MSCVPSSRALARSPTSRFLRARAAVSFSLSTAMLLRWPSTRCRATPSVTLGSVSVGVVPRTTLASALRTALLPHRLTTSACLPTDLHLVLMVDRSTLADLLPVPDLKVLPDRRDLLRYAAIYPLLFFFSWT